MIDFTALEQARINRLVLARQAARARASASRARRRDTTTPYTQRHLDRAAAAAEEREAANEDIISESARETS